LAHAAPGAMESNVMVAGVPIASTIAAIALVKNRFTIFSLVGRKYGPE
jgi:hypothetical protein